MTSEEKKPLILFECKTHNAYSFKILIDVLNYYLNKKGSFLVNSGGIFLCNTNPKEDVLCDLKLLSENFQEYFLFKNQTICFSINLNTFYNEMLKKIKKKDAITLQIMREDDDRMYIKVTKESVDNKDNHVSAKAAVLETKHIPMSPPEGYGQPINILSKIFQQSCREITRPSNKEIEVTCWNEKTIRFYASKDGVVENEAVFGSRQNEQKETRCETFKDKCPAAHIVRPAKLAGLGETVKIFVKKDLPLRYKMRVGCLGDIEIYIKTVEQVKSEKDTNDDEGDTNK